MDEALARGKTARLGTTGGWGSSAAQAGRRASATARGRLCAGLLQDPASFAGAYGARVPLGQLSTSSSGWGLGSLSQVKPQASQ